MADIRFIDLDEAAAPGDDYWVPTDSETDGAKRIKPSNLVTPSDLGLVIGTDVQAYSSNLDAYNAKTAPSGAVVGTSDTQTLTGKTIDGGSNMLTNIPASAIPDLGTAATSNSSDFATAAQGTKADSAVQPGSLAAVATSGNYNDLTGKPTIPAAGLPVGGASGQVLRKNSGTDYDVAWSSVGTGDMLKSDDLSGLASVATARVNLDIDAFSPQGVLLTTGADLNSITKNGFYMVQDPVNSPLAGWMFIIHQAAYGGSTNHIQRLRALGSNTEYLRNCSSGTWSPWVQTGAGMSSAVYDPTNQATDVFAFVQAGTGAASRTVQNKARDILSVKDFGAIGNGSTDDATAFANAYNAAISLGGATILIPPGNYILSSFPTTGAYVTWQGVGRGSQLTSTATTGDFVTIAGANSWIKDVCLSTNVRKTSGFMLTLGHGIIEGAIGVRIEYGYNGLHVLDVSQGVFDRIEVANLLGIYGIYISGTSTINTTGVRFSNITVAGALVPSAAVDRGPWAASTTYSVNDVVTNSGNLYICSTAGKSAGSGGPSGLPLTGTTPQTAFSNTIVDGSVQWQFLNAGTNLFVMDSYSYSLRMSNVALLWGYQGFVMQDAAGLGAASMPKWVHSAHNIECDTNWSHGLVLSKGGGFHSTNSWYGTSKTGMGVFIASTFAGDVSIVNSRINNNFNAGVYLEAGPVNTYLADNFIGANSIVGVGASAGFVAATNARSFTLIGNRIGPLPSLGGSGNQNGIILINGNDNFLIAGNDVSGNNAPIAVGTLPGTPGQTFCIKDNRGLKTKMNVAVTLNSGATATTVTHGLAGTPRVQDVQITPAGGWGSSGQWYINPAAMTSTTLEINTAANPGAGVYMNIRAGIWGDW